MASLYNQTMSQMLASDDLKQKTFAGLLEKLEESKSNKPTTRLKKAFNPKHIIAGVAAAVMVLCAIFLPFMLMNDEAAILDQRLGLAWGYNDSEPSNPFYCAYKSDKNEFDVDDITLTFFYASVSGTSQELDSKIYNVELFFAHDKEGGVIPDYEPDSDPDAYFIKEVYDFYSEQSRRRAAIDGKSLLEYKFPFSEQLTIPKELLIKQKGIIYFEFWEYETACGQKKYGGGGGAPIYYKLSGQKVILSANPLN